MAGPCSAWVDLADVVADPRAKTQDGVALPPALLQEKIYVASEILYALSGRQFAGVCNDVVRPTARWYRTDYQPGWWGYYWPRTVDTFTDRNPHRYDGSGALQEITLGAYPLRAILHVRVNGTIVPSTDYRIDDRRWLVNISAVPWPTMQDMAADPLTGKNTMEVAFEWGQAPNDGGVASAKRYAIELAKAASGDPCALPERVTSLQMQGSSYSFLDPMTFLEKGRVGIYEIDAWLASVNPNGLKRRSAVYSPDVPRPVRRTSSTPGS